MKERLKKFSYIVLIIAAVFLGFYILNSCEKSTNKNSCISFLELFQDSDYYHDLYYDKCKKISGNEGEIEQCMYEMKISTKEIKDYCNDYIELNDNYNEY